MVIDVTALQNAVASTFGQVDAAQQDLAAFSGTLRGDVDNLAVRVATLEGGPGGSSSFRSVKDFGAVGNGVADDTVAIQAAFDAGPGFVFFPAGTYMISDSILFRANVTGFGEFGATTVKAAPNSFLNGLFVSSGPIPMFGLRNMCLNGNRMQQGGFPGTSVGLRLAHSSTSAGFGGELNDAYGRFENLMIESVDGDGVVAAGSACHMQNITVLGCHGKGIVTSMNDAVWIDCTVGGCAEEGWLCFAGSGRYYGCKAFFVGTGQNPADGTFGNYNLGFGFRITNGNQLFVGCEGQDTDGPAFRVQGGRLMLSGCYASQACNLVGTSRNIGQNPTRGGGYVGERCAFQVWHNDGCKVDGIVRDRLIDIGGGANRPNLDSAVHLNNADDTMVSVGGDKRALRSGGVWVRGTPGVF